MLNVFFAASFLFVSSYLSNLSLSTSRRWCRVNRNLRKQGLIVGLHSLVSSSVIFCTFIRSCTNLDLSFCICKVCLLLKLQALRSSVESLWAWEKLTFARGKEFFSPLLSEANLYAGRGLEILERAKGI